MRLTRTHRTLTTWLALWCLVLGSVLPAVAQAGLRWTGDSDWIEVCASTGMVWVKLDGTQAESPPHEDTQPDTSPLGMSCPWCLTSHTIPALPPAPAAAVFAPIALNERPPAFWQAADTDHIWRSALARAPPGLT